MEEILLGWWDTHKGSRRTVYNVIKRYADHYSITKSRFSTLMSTLGKALAERKAWHKGNPNQTKLFKGGA